MIIRITACMAVACGMALSVAHAQPLPPSTLASKASEPKSDDQMPSGTAYRSAWDGYRPYADEPTVSWTAANERVKQIGGWRVYAQEAAADDPKPDGSGGHSDHGASQGASKPATVESVPPRAPAPAGHSHHH